MALLGDGTIPPESGVHALRADNYTSVSAPGFHYGLATRPNDSDTHVRRADNYTFVPALGFQHGNATRPNDSGVQGYRADNYTFVPASGFHSGDATRPNDSDTHVRRVVDFAFGERATHRGDATLPTESRTHSVRGDAFTFVLPDQFFFDDGLVPLEAGIHPRRADDYTRVTREQVSDFVGFGVMFAFGQRRPGANEISCLGTPLGRGRRTDFQVVGLGALVGAGRKTDRQVIGLGTINVQGQRSRPPEAMAVGAPEGFGQRRAVPQFLGVGELAASGHRSSTAAGEISGIGDAATIVSRSEFLGLGDIQAGGQRLFRRRYLQPGFVKMRPRAGPEEWTTEPPERERPFEVVARSADSPWYGPFDWNTYTDNFFPGDVRDGGVQLLALDDTSALLVYRHSGTSAQWTPAPSSPWHAGRMVQEFPIVARRLFRDPLAETVTAGPEIVMTDHPLADGAGDNEPDDSWRTYSKWWTVEVLSSSATETRIVFRLFDDTGFYDPFRPSGRTYYFNGVRREDWGWSSAGLIVFTFNWTDDSVTKGAFHRLGGPVGLKAEHVGQEISGVPAADQFYDNPTSSEYWNSDKGGQSADLVAMLTSSRGVAVYANSLGDSELCVESFDVTGDGVAFLDSVQLPHIEGSTDNNLSTGEAPIVLALSGTRFVVFGPKAYNNATDRELLRTWVFDVGVDGSIAVGGAATFGSYPDNVSFTYGGSPQAAVVRSDRVVFHRTDEATGRRSSLAVITIPASGPPTYAQLLDPEALGYPATSDVHSLAVQSDGEGHWAAVWAARDASSGDYHLFARGGRIDAYGVASRTDAISLNSHGNDSYYWLHWSCWQQPNRLLYGWLSDWSKYDYVNNRWVVHEYAIRSAVVELTGGPGDL